MEQSIDGLNRWDSVRNWCTICLWLIIHWCFM